MSDLDLQVVVATVSFGAYLWVSLYLVSRASRFNSLIILSITGSLIQACYFFHNVCVNVVTGYDLGIVVNRYGWWTNTIPIAMWFHLSLIMQQRRKFPHLIIIFSYGTCLVITLVGLLSNLLLNYDNPIYDRPGHLYVKVGPFYWVYIVYLGLVGLGAFYNFASLYRQMQKGEVAVTVAIRRKVAMLAIGSLAFVAGGVYLALKVNFFLVDLPDYPAFISLLMGLALYGYALTHYDLLIEGKDIGRDFAYSFVALLLVNVSYIAIITPVGFKSPIAILLTVGLITTSHTLYYKGQDVLDKLFFNKAEQEARTGARDYATDLAIQPVAIAEMPQVLVTGPEAVPPGENDNEGKVEEDSLGEKAFKDAVRRAISGLKNPTQLVKSPLLTLKIVENRVAQNNETDNRLNRAAVLKSLLIELIERLRPNGGERFGTTDAWRFYNVLYLPYVREISKKDAYAQSRRLIEERRKNGVREPGDLEQALEWLSDVEENTYYKWQRRASDMLASILLEEEQRLVCG